MNSTKQLEKTRDFLRIAKGAFTSIMLHTAGFEAIEFLKLYDATTMRLHKSAEALKEYLAKIDDFRAFCVSKLDLPFEEKTLKEMEAEICYRMSEIRDKWDFKQTARAVKKNEKLIDEQFRWFHLFLYEQAVKYKQDENAWGLQMHYAEYSKETEGENNDRN